MASSQAVLQLERVCGGEGDPVALPIPEEEPVRLERGGVARDPTGPLPPRAGERGRGCAGVGVRGRGCAGGGVRGWGVLLGVRVRGHLQVPNRMGKVS